MPAKLYNFSASSKNHHDPVPLFDKTTVDFHSPIGLLTITDVAALLKISVSGVRRLYQGKHLPFVKVGGSVRFFTNDIKSYLEKRRVEPIEQTQL